jgi:hypothetical protein
MHARRAYPPRLQRRCGRDAAVRAASVAGTFDVKRVAGSADITTVTSRLPWACVRRLTPLKRVHLAHPHPRLRQHLQEE